MTAALLLDNLALTATLSGGTWARPLDYLLEPTVRETTARCVAGTPDHAWFDIVFPAPTKWDTLVLAGGTPRPDVDLRVTWYADPVDRSAGAVLRGGAGAPFLAGYPPPLRLRQRRLFDPNVLKGRPRARDLAGKTPMLVIRPASSPRCAAVRVEIDNHGDQLDLGMLVIGAAFVPQWPHDFGLRQGAPSRSPTDEAPGGRRVVDARPAARTKTFKFSILSEDEAMVLADAGQRLDRSGVLMMIEDVADQRHLWRRTWPATLADGGIEVEQVNEQDWQADVKLLEVIG